MMQIRFGASFSNQLSGGVEQQAVYQRVIDWSQENPAVKFLMDPALTPDITLKVVQRDELQEFRVDKESPYGKGFAFDLGKSLKQMTAGKGRIIQALVRELVMSSGLLDKDGPNPIVKLSEALKTESTDTARSVLHAAMKSLEPPYPYRYKLPVSIPIPTIELPAIRLERSSDTIVTESLTPSDAPIVGTEAQPQLFNACQTLVKRITTDPALQFALQESVSPGVKLKVTLSEPAYIESGYPKSDAVAYLSLEVQFANGKTERIPFGNNLKSFNSRGGVIRDQILRAVADNTAEPTATLNALDAFARQHTQPVTYINFVLGSFKGFALAGA